MLRHRIFEVLKRLEVLGISPVDPRFAKSAVHAVDGVDAFNLTVREAECFFELFQVLGIEPPAGIWHVKVTSGANSQTQARPT